MKKITHLLVLLVLASLTSCSKSDELQKPQSPTVTQPESPRAKQAFALKSPCFEEACSVADLATGSLIDPSFPFQLGSVSGTLDEGVLCYLEDQNLCSATLSQPEVLIFARQGFGDIEIENDAIFLLSGHALITSEQQEDIMDVALALAQQYAPNCGNSSQKKVVSNIDFVSEQVLGGEAFLQMAVEYSCCGPTSLYGRR